MSSRFVAAIQMTPSLPCMPSISTSSWLSVTSSSPDRFGPPAAAAERVELVDEDDARRLLAGLLRELPHALRADADVHLVEVRAGRLDHRHARLAATARASSVLPVPGGPTRRSPFGHFAPIARKRGGSLR
jgi:hypothetical protein